MLAYLRWHGDQASLVLSARQCADLAKACAFAGKKSPDQEAGLWRLMAELFNLCAQAGFAHLPLILTWPEISVGLAE